MQKKNLFNLVKLDQKSRDDICAKLMPKVKEINFKLGQTIEFSYKDEKSLTRESGIVMRIYGKSYMKFVQLCTKNKNIIILPLFDEKITFKLLNIKRLKVRRSNLSYLAKK